MQSIDQSVNRSRGVLVGDIGELGVASGGDGARVSEQTLNMAKTQPLFKEMGREAMPKRVDRDFFLSRTGPARLS